MRPCVIFNPAAKGEKARKFRTELDHIAGASTFKLTGAAGDARRLAAEAIHEGHVTVVAAGGDGTLNEVLNGIGDVVDGFRKARLAVVPLGTMNVFARELGIPLKPHEAWNLIESGREIRVDLPWIERTRDRTTVRHYFTQMAGAGLDARAIELVDWKIKKRVGPLAYLLAGLRAMGERPVAVKASTNGMNHSGPLALVGNGRLYGGSFRLFPDASPQDGLLEVCVFPRVSWWTLLQGGPRLLLTGRVPENLVRRMRAKTVMMESGERAGVEVDGELAGDLPVTFGLEPLGLRVVVPP